MLQCTPIAKGVVSFRRVTTFQQPIIVAAPSVPMPLSFVASSCVSEINSHILVIVLAHTLIQASISVGVLLSCKAL